jgi:hypothetical protein
MGHFWLHNLMISAGAAASGLNDVMSWVNLLSQSVTWFLAKSSNYVQRCLHRSMTS